MHTFDEVSVGIDKGDTVTVGDILTDQRFQQCCFTRPRFADDVNMTHSVTVSDPEWDTIASRIGDCEIRYRSNHSS